MLFLRFCTVASLAFAVQGLAINGTRNSTGQYPKLIEATTEQLADGLHQGHFTSVDLVRAYIARINDVNSTLQAVVEINPDALAIAAELDAARAKGQIKGPLHGLPFLIKNNIATADQMNNTAGSYALLGAKVSRDAPVVSKMRAAGAIILGKSNLSQWANYRSGNTSNGWSALGGQTTGAYCPQHDPSGSSSGSGVAASVGLALAALGTETDGSITAPSSVNNVVGIKPSVGLTSRSLVIPISSHQDTVGPMARTVKDAAYLLQAIAGKDPGDNYTSAIPSVGNYVQACKVGALHGVKLGVPRNLISGDGPVTAAFEEAITTIRGLGATVVDANVADGAHSDVAGQILAADFLSDLPAYLSKLSTNPQEITSVETLRNFTQRFPTEAFPDRDTGIWDSALSSFNNSDPRFWPMYQQNVASGGIHGVLGAIQNNSLDALIVPADFAPDLPARVGSPIVTVPMGFYPQDQAVQPSSRGLVAKAPNMPFGLSFLGLHWSEEKLIGYAYDYEQKTRTREKVQPVVVPQTELADVVGKT